MASRPSARPMLHSRIHVLTVAGIALIAGAACGRSTPPEPTSTTSETVPAAPAVTASAAAKPEAMGGGGAGSSAMSSSGAGGDTAGMSSTADGEKGGKAPAPAKGKVVKQGGPDPLEGKFTLADATKDLKGSGALVATIDTSMGALRCKLYEDKAPNTVANFVGLARGLRVWKDPNDAWVLRPAYDGTDFHRIIKGFMIQGGDPKGNGAGEPGYTIKDELWSGAKHDRAGLLCMANRGHDTNGQQFFITDAAAAHLDGNYTIFGECSPEKTVHDIANSPLRGEKPVTPVAIKTVTVAREKAAAK
jgi:peptidyl-prolyl cis-trans isomerase A (cyclophilin A)